MASSLAFLGEKMALKPMVFKFQGFLMKSCFQDDNLEIKDIDLGHTNLGEFLKICNKPTERSQMVSTLIWSLMVNVASHSVLLQSLELIVTLVEHLVPEERVVKSLIGEIVLDLQPKNIEKIFHLPWADQFIKLTYEQEKRWYWENIEEASEII